MKRNMTIAIVMLMVMASFGYGADWNQWRGPNRDGKSADTGLLKQWPEAGPELVWKATGLGIGYCGIAISGDSFYTMGDEGKDSYVYCYSLAEGKKIWSKKIGKAGAPGWGNFQGPRSTPTVEGGMVYVIGQYGEIACLKASDGSVVWNKHLVDDFGGRLPEWGYSESVLIDNGNFICTPGGNNGAILALDKKTGNVAWRTVDFKDEAHYSSIVVCEIEGVKQYVQLTPASVVGVATDGKLLWRGERKGRTAVIPTPVVSGNKVYVTSGYGVGCNLFEVRKSGNNFSVKEVYAMKNIADQIGGVVLVDGYIYGHCDAKGWTCQKFDTGEIMWSEKKEIGKGAIAYADGCLIIRAETKGQVGLLEATPDGYKEKGRFIQPEFGKSQTWAHPIVAGGKLYLRDNDNLFCYEIAK